MRVRESLIKLVATCAIVVLQGNATAAQACADHGSNVLIVHESSTIRRIVRNLLNEIGYARSSEAADPAQAYSMFQQTRYDLVLSGLNFSPLSGMSLLQRIRSDEHMGQTPFVMIISSGPKPEDLRAIAQVNGTNRGGPIAVLTTPFNGDKLGSKLSYVCNFAPAP